MIARVEPLTTTRRLSGPFDYKADGLALDVGSIVRIPFGHQQLDGVVVALTDSTDVPEEKLVVPTDVRDDSVPRDLVDTALWIAEEYCSTPARALQIVTPPPGKAKTYLFAEPTGETGKLTAKQQELMERLPGPAGKDLAALRRLEARGLVTISERTERRVPRTNATEDRAHELTQPQVEALKAIDEGGSHLLHGVTGSGKTEVYLRAAQACLERGEGVIVLVPEIALTPQTVARFQARFGDTVALLHSALSEGERYDEWRRLRTNEARIAVGPRSAVFAPVDNLGLIVVDEEHDASYKQDGDPRYDARHVAAFRAYQSGARLVAGSATPRPETVHTMHRLRLPARVEAAGKKPLVFAEDPAPPGVAPPRPALTPRRADGLPPVRILDMRESQHSLHPETRRAILATRKSIVLLNRRGWSNFLSCKTCGKAWECPRCDVALVLHRAQHEIACHHCGHKEPVPKRCDNCGSLAVARHGAGTERVEHELRQMLDVPIFRLDADTTSTKDAVPELLARFHASSSGLLLGTQMVAKGHDFPDVTLGVVLDADSTLRFPDFRAEERTFALIAQLAGRAGRGPKGGRVLVQTRSPDAPSIVAAANHDSDGFLREELARRKAHEYPPFADIIRVVTSAADPDAARSAAAAIAEHITVPETQLLGPAPLFRLRDRERFQLVLKTHERAAAIHATGHAVEDAARAKAFKEVNFSVDVDPV
ncbi:primosomal protein N' [Solirubrobacter sp. CPCC 204708]|uniref:Replication restart protein PriA n=1 Tax=Solirubrobacter deserti TaxID=2282478 RepID=A0ABT4RR75_9ACTN|nr:primosomal protein N' [Solirubrobacter deserti]MBE2314750.1 primosomal protein N' [Solirubrobacter deserti]MDA0141067.1 primosomal protein N' [Solirubrobacter deserti]